MSVPTGLSRKAKKTRRASERQEHKIAKDIGGRRQPGSGGGPWNKDDVRKEGKFRVEAKMTSKKSFSVKRSDLAKVRGHCELGEVPLMQIQFTDEQRNVEEQWVVIPYDYWRHKVKEE